MRRRARRLLLGGLLVPGLAVFSAEACARPFRFPPPLELIREEPHRDPGKHPLWDKSLGLWRFEDIDV